MGTMQTNIQDILSKMTLEEKIALTIGRRPCFSGYTWLCICAWRAEQGYRHLAETLCLQQSRKRAHVY